MADESMFFSDAESKNEEEERMNNLAFIGIWPMTNKTRDRLLTVTYILAVLAICAYLFSQ